MDNTFSFKKAKLKSMNIELLDGRTLKIGMPTKRLTERLIEIQEEITACEDVAEQYNKAYKLTADILSSNWQGYEITYDFVADTMDHEDIVNFISAYSQFVLTEAGNPNLHSPTTL